MTAPRRPANGRFLPCRWSCVICEQDGTVRVWVLLGEPIDRAIRWHMSATRAKCLPTCAYTADCSMPLTLTRSKEDPRA